MKQWWAQYKGCKSGPCETREAAAKRIFDLPRNKAKSIMTGYGTFGPDFDIQWVSRDEANAK